MKEQDRREEQKIDNPKLVDLTYYVSPEMNVWPGDKRPEFQQISKISSDGVNLSRFSISSHTGTHIDAPNHFIKGGSTIEELSIDNTCGEAVIFRTKEKPDGGTVGLEEVKKSKLEPDRGNIFILNSGLEGLGKGKNHHQNFPVPSTELLECLLDQGMKCYGTDCPSIDPPQSKTHENHKLLLEKGIPVIENLARLDRLEAKERVKIYAFPLKLKGLEASPCRAVALIED